MNNTAKALNNASSYAYFCCDISGMNKFLTRPIHHSPFNKNTNSFTLSSAINSTSHFTLPLPPKPLAVEPSVPVSHSSNTDLSTSLLTAGGLVLGGALLLASTFMKRQ